MEKYDIVPSPLLSHYFASKEGFHPSLSSSVPSGLFKVNSIIVIQVPQVMKHLSAKPQRGMTMVASRFNGWSNGGADERAFRVRDHSASVSRT